MRSRITEWLAEAQLASFRSCMDNIWSLTGKLVKRQKEQEKRITALENRLEKLELDNKVEELEQELKEIKGRRDYGANEGQ